MYFAVQTFTTVGYGDFTPKTTEGKIFVCFYIHLALVCIAIAVTLQRRKRLIPREKREDEIEMEALMERKR